MWPDPEGFFVTSPNCSSGCLTKDHATYGECIRSKSFRIAYCQSASNLDASRQKRWDKELDAYRSAVAQGIEPDSTAGRDIRKAVEWSNETGIAYSDEARADYQIDKVLERQ